jgi:hypothetical protein
VQCQGPLWVAYHNRRTITTLTGVYCLTLRIRRCINAACPRYHRAYRPKIEYRLDTLVKPAVFAELDYYRHLGHRNRLLGLPVMVALVLALIWRRVPGVCTLQRMLAHERILWIEPTTVSQPALSERFLTFPAVLFERILYRVLARLPERQAARTCPGPVTLSTLRTSSTPVMPSMARPWRRSCVNSRPCASNCQRLSTDTWASRSI